MYSYEKRRKETQTQHTTQTGKRKMNNYYRIPAWVPSLENWDGGLKIDQHSPHMYSTWIKEYYVYAVTSLSNGKNNAKLISYMYKHAMSYRMCIYRNKSRQFLYYDRTLFPHPGKVVLWPLHLSVGCHSCGWLTPAGRCCGWLPVWWEEDVGEASPSLSVVDKL